MFIKVCFRFLGILVAFAFLSGCKPGDTPEAAVPPAYFQTSFQTESQFVIETIVSDLAEQVYYAAKHQLPDKKYFSITSREKSGSTIDTPTYVLQINLDQQHKGLKLDLKVDGPIWSPAVYREVTAALAKAMKLNATGTAKKSGTELVTELLDGTAETIERESLTVSDALEKNFTNPQLHEKAALLLGAFALREHAGCFFDARAPLSRLTAHLAMARFLSGTDSFGVNGQLAETMMLTVACNETLALEELKSFDTNDTAVASMVRALRTRSTGDFRPLTDAADRTEVESVAWFAAMADYASCSGAWTKLKDKQKKDINFVRVANEGNYSVEMGHELLESAIPLEMREIERVYEFAHDNKLKSTEVVEALNETAGRCFSSGPGEEIHVRVLDWGQWAMFFQRHLCHTMQQNFNFMYRDWVVPDDAKKFAAQCDQQFEGLRLYPFVRRFNCTDIEAYHKSIDDGLKLTIATPQFVPAACWNHLCYRPDFAPTRYLPNPNPHINEWHNHNPLPGTLYDFIARLDHPSLVERPDAVARFEELHEMAPYFVPVGIFITKKKYKDKPTYDQAMELYGPLLPWSVSALRTVADTVHDKPAQYEKLMLQAAAYNASVYYELGDYAISLKQDDKAAQYIDKACDTDADSVRASGYARWRIEYYLKKGQTAKAREIADFGGEVYSFTGLDAKAYFMEVTKNYAGALEWYTKIEERYNDSSPVIAFCERYKKATGDSRFDSEIQRRMKGIFPKGKEKASLGDFRVAPKDGVLIRDESDLLRENGMKQGDVIVALKGTRVHNLLQYEYVRESLETPELDLIVWQGNGYREIKSSPPDHRFGVDIGDYKQGQRADE